MFKQMLKQPTILLPKQHILLCSHMRANTTLLGHILGSHPDISGYYEHHIGYSSWKSLIRNKMKFCQENPAEPVTKYYFDKILHNEHYLTEEVMQHKNVVLFFMLRRPERTIKSIVNLYRKIDPQNDFASAEFATNYYISRVEKIAVIARNYAQRKPIYYLDAEMLVESTDEALQTLSSWFGLTPPLNAEYRLFALTGKKRYGDSSEHIKSGSIKQSRDCYKSIELDAVQLNKANYAYHNARTGILALAQQPNYLAIA